MGSGKLISLAIKKYGIDSFKKEILFECLSEQEMNDKEKELVVPNLETNYNLCPGGQGGFGYINNHSKHKEWARLGAIKINSLGLAGKGRMSIPKNNCKECKRLITSKSGKIFCSRSCSVSFNNKCRGSLIQEPAL